MTVLTYNKNKGRKRKNREKNFCQMKRIEGKNNIVIKGKTCSKIKKITERSVIKIKHNLKKLRWRDSINNKRMRR